MGKVSKIMSNSFYFFLDWVVMTLGGYLFWVVIGRLTNPGDVGLFSTILSLSILLTGFTSLGMNSVLPKLIPEYQIKKSNQKVSGIIWWSLKTTTIVNVALALLLVAASPIISSTGYIGGTEVMQVAVLLIAINTFYLLGSCLYGLQDIRKIAITDTLMTLLKIAATLALVFAGYKYLGLVYGTAIAMAVSSVFRIVRMPRGAGTIDTKEIWFYALPAIVSTFGTVLINQGNVVALSFFRPMPEVGIFTIAFLFASILRTVPQIMSMAIFPIASQQWAGRDRSGLKKLVTQTTRYSLLLVSPLMLAFVIFPKNIILYLVNDSYAGSSLILPVLAVGYAAMGMSSIFTNVLYSIGKVVQNRNVTLAGGFSNILLSLAAIPFIGVLGASVAFLLSGVAMLALSMAWLGRYIKFDPALKDTAKILFASIIFSVSVVLLNSVNGSLLWFVLSFALGIVAYGITLLITRFFGQTDLRILGELKAKAPGRLAIFFALAEKLISKFSN